MMSHNDFPKMTDAFDHRVRQTLDSLPEQPQRVRRFPFKRAVSIGLVAALCVGGTAFAASDLPQAIGRHFELLLNGTDEQLLNDYTVTPAPGAATAENDKYRMTVESVLFDESAGAGLVSLHLENKLGDGVMPFGILELYPQYQNLPDVVWSSLSQCYGSKDGQYNFNVMYDEYGFCGSAFYLDTSRSTENDYYIEGAFIPSGDYTPGTPLRFVAQEVGKTQTVSSGAGIGYITLEVSMADFEQMPCLKSADGSLTLSQIGLRMTAQQPGDMLVDRIEQIAVKMKDGSELVMRENGAGDGVGIDQTLYALGFGPDAGFTSDTVVYVLAQTFDLADVQSVVINDTEYPLAA
ncbi:hypothetical protein [Agathobaculum sp.]|uniref:hypothetical protein n=1 Tax=Agathobaculum sp. TaxID=2048138 RepID=UPI0027B9D692|nr:hypothetical protein [Agathobaculum sp.]